MDKRSKTILNYLVYHSQKDSRALTTEFDITRNQLNYSIKKINEWCREKHIPEIKRMRNGYFYLPDELLNLLKQEEASEKVTATTVYSYTEKDRGHLILLMIFTKSDYLSLDHFMIDLNISKNMAVRSLRYLRDDLPDNIELSYSRNEGYDLIGNEWDLRKLLIKTVTSLYKVPDGSVLLKRFTHIVAEEIMTFHQILEKAEKSLNVKFSDDRMETLPYILAIVVYRINTNHLIQESFQINNRMLADTKEFAFVNEMFEHWTKIPDQEKLYITLQLLTINVVSGELLTEVLAQQLSQVVEKCLTNFEKKACVTLKDKQNLKERMVLHLKPAFYRIRYHLHLKMKVEDCQMDSQHFAFKELVREAFEPLQVFIGERIPEEEFTFIALFVLSALSEGKKAREAYKAVVVCKSGVLISQTLNTFLQKIFPEFTFLPPISLRTFPKYKDQIDVVFSTVPIKGVKQLFIVKPTMNQVELELLKNHVLSELDVGYQQKPKITLESILAIVERNTQIINRRILERQLTQLFHKDDRNSRFMASKEVGLLDLLTLETIQIVNKVADYQTAIRMASSPLVQKGHITHQYVQAIIDAYDMEESYMVLGSEVVIPHARPEDGVNQLSCSLLYVREGIKFSEDSLIYFVFIVAPANRESHIHALFEIMNIAEDTAIMESMKESRTPQELLNSIQMEKVDS